MAARGMGAAAGARRARRRSTDRLINIEKGTLMQTLQDRRRFLATLSSAGAAGLVGAGNSFAQDGPPETTTIRLSKGTLICNAPQYIADELLRAEGFTDVQHVSRISGTPQEALTRGELDFTMSYLPPAIVAIDSGAPIAVVTGILVGCNALFAHEGIRGIRDLKGKKVGASGVGSPLLSSMAAYVGLDPAKDIEWVIGPSAKDLFVARKIDAFMALPPDPQDLRARKVGHVIVDAGLDRPWSQLFCCGLASSREFVRKHPVATKRVLRAILKATDFCANDPAGAARRMVAGGFTSNYDYALQSLSETGFNKWREYDAEDSMRFYSLRLREAGMIKSVPGKIIADGTDWRFLNELKREMKA
jgi:NitT/TauT family transport system substrate-binding protein